MSEDTVKSVAENMLTEEINSSKKRGFALVYPHPPVIFQDECKDQK